MLFKMLTYPITTHFGEIDNFHRAPHSGVDYACPLGTPAQSVSDGIVNKISENPMLGENIRVTASGNREWVYGHLSKVDVTTGQHVASGDVIGLTGGVPGMPGAGHSTGAHIHISMLSDGKIVDPTVMLNTASSGTSNGGWLSNLFMSGPHMPSPTELMFNGIGHCLTTFVHVMPEVCGVLSMILMLAGMCGSRKAMSAAGTGVILMFVGVILNAAIQ